MELKSAPAAKPIKIPGPDHPITVEHNPNRVVVSLGGRVIADTREALTLREAAYPAVQYIPRKDVDMALLARTDHATYCPYKGDSSYFSIPLGGALGERGLDVRESLCGRQLHRGPSRLLSRPRRRGRRTVGALGAYRLKNPLGRRCLGSKVLHPIAATPARGHRAAPPESVSGGALGHERAGGCWHDPCIAFNPGLRDNPCPGRAYE